VIHDLVFPLPEICLLLLLSHRAPAVVTKIKVALQRRKDRRAAALQHAAAAPAAAAPAAAPAAATAAPAAATVAPVAAPAALPARKSRFRSELWEEFFRLVIDVPFLLCGLFVTLTLWRAPLLFALLRKYQYTLRERRLLAAYQALCMLRDLLFLVPFVMIVATVYRAVPLIRRINAKRSKWIATDPMLQLSALSIGFFKPDASPTIRIHATKDAALGVRAVELRLIGETFWGAVGNAVGKVLVNIAEGFMPVCLSEKDGNIQYSALAAGLADVEFTIDLAVAMKQTTLAKKLKLIGSPSVVLHAEALLHGSNERRVLFATVIATAELIRMADAPKQTATELAAASLPYQVRRQGCDAGTTVGCVVTCYATLQHSLPCAARCWSQLGLPCARAVCVCVCVCVRVMCVRVCVRGSAFVRACEWVHEWVCLVLL
jgi:hypothetical protein